jgi:hypothetical protein
MQENSDRTDLASFTALGRYGLLDGGPRRVAGLLKTTVLCKCTAGVLNCFMKWPAWYLFGDMPT